MKVVVAIDSLKGSLSSMEAGYAIQEGICRADPAAQVMVRPLADGGEGTVDALVSANAIANPNLIYPGQVLHIPGA